MAHCLILAVRCSLKYLYCTSHLHIPPALSAVHVHTSGTVVRELVLIVVTDQTLFLPQAEPFQPAEQAREPVAQDRRQSRLHLQGEGVIGRADF